MANPLDLAGSDARAFPKDFIRSNPSIYEATVVSDLESAVLDRFDDMKELASLDLAKNDVIDLKRHRIDWFDNAELSRFDSPLHGRATWTKRHRFASAQLLDVMRCPAHRSVRTQDTSND
ncbi:MAG: hypothetical protein ABW110_00620 [Steroidobacteraceae bacterium]